VADGPNLQPNHAQETAWIQAAQNGDRQAFDALAELHGRGVVRYLDGLTRNAADAEDLTQEALLQAFRGIRSFQRGSDFRAWLLKIAYHEWVHLVRRKKKVTAVSPETLNSVPANSAPTGGDELAAATRAAVQKLPDEQRAVVLLRFGEGLSHSEIARITGSEVATVRWRLFRARQTLQKALKPWAPLRVASDEVTGE
jgi:RNA polymerase sigma-70 factor (ECF subfamily)